MAKRGINHQAKRRGALGQVEAGSAYFAAQGLETGHFGPMWHILKAARLLETELNRVSRGHGISIADFHLLGALMMERGPLRATDLAHALTVSNAVLTSRLRRLAAAGLIDRKADPADARTAMVFLSRDGAEKVRAIGGAIEREARFMPYFRQLPDTRRDALALILGDLHAWLDRDFDPAPRSGA